MAATSAWLLWLLLVIVHDFRQRRVPNWLVLAGAFGALAVLATGTQPFGTPWTGALSACALGFGVLLLFYAAGMMGAGDVKFAGALGLWLGLQPLVEVWLVAGLLAGLHSALWYLLRNRSLWPWLARALLYAPAAPPGAEGRAARPRHVPYAAYLALTAIGWTAWRQ